MTRAYKPVPTPAELWDLFELNPLTGQLFWRLIPSTKCNSSGKAGSLTVRGYVQLTINQQKYWAHRIVRAWVDGKDPGKTVLDHADRNKSNNQPWNIRICTQSENLANISGRKGYYFCSKKRKYAARINVNKKQVFLGYFSTAQEASACYNAAKCRLYGEFAA